MKITVVAMVKNEQGVIKSFCEHLLALFDHVIIVDHNSVDGTRKFLEKLAITEDRLHLLAYQQYAYHQAALMTWIVKNRKECQEADWIFFLDADEVLPFKDKDQFHRGLEEFSSFPVIRMHWSNLVPYDDIHGAFIGKIYLESQKHAFHSKIAFQPSLIPISDYSVAQGNHALLAGNSNKEFPSHKAFNLYHIPIRNKEQLALKLVQGVHSYLLVGKNRDKALGNHWFQIAGYIRNNGMAKELLNGLVVTYGMPLNDSDISVSNTSLIGLGYTKIKLDCACISLDSIAENIIDYPEVLLLSMADFSSLENPDDDSIFDPHKIVEIGGQFMTVKNQDENDQCKFPTLESREIVITQNVYESVINFIGEGNDPIETLTPTAWGGHIPFLFSLIASTKPRVYVELGSHYGASFFAACQAIKKLEASSSSIAVAIDLWEGDDHTGAYEEGVYNDFMYLLETRYRDVGMFLRKLFDDALDNFSEGSIDLLHIDGLHTYEAVKHDFETWKGKVSEDGVILFHDTNEFDNNFGVWKLWEEISGQYTSFEFKHTHGLGVIALGNSPLVPILKLLKDKPDLEQFFEKHFERTGELCTFEAYQKLQNESRSRELENAFKTFNGEENMRSKARRMAAGVVKNIPVVREAAYYVYKRISK